MAKGSRLPGKEGVRVGVIPIAFTFLSMGTGEPDTSKVVCPVRGGTGRKGSNDLARGLPYLLRRSRFRQQVSASVRLQVPPEWEEGMPQRKQQRSMVPLSLCINLAEHGTGEFEDSQSAAARPYRRLVPLPFNFLT